MRKGPVGNAPTMYAQLPHEELLFRAQQIRTELKRRAKSAYSQDGKVGAALKLLQAAGAQEGTADVVLDTAVELQHPELVSRVAEAVANKRWSELHGNVSIGPCSHEHQFVEAGRRRCLYCPAVLDEEQAS